MCIRDRDVPGKRCDHYVMLCVMIGAETVYSVSYTHLYIFYCSVTVQKAKLREVCFCLSPLNNASRIYACLTCLGLQLRASSVFKISLQKVQTNFRRVFVSSLK